MQVDGPNNTNNERYYTALIYEIYVYEKWCAYIGDNSTSKKKCIYKYMLFFILYKSPVKLI